MQVDKNIINLVNKQYNLSPLYILIWVNKCTYKTQSYNVR